MPPLSEYFGRKTGVAKHQRRPSPLPDSYSPTIKKLGLSQKLPDEFHGLVWGAGARAHNRMTWITPLSRCNPEQARLPS